MPDPAKPTVKQQRDARRAEKVAELRKKLARDKRNRLIGIIAGAAAALVTLTLVIVFVVTSSTPKPSPDDITVEGVKDFGTLTAVHVTTPVDYEADYGMNPPAGGNHFQAWLNCGVYDQPQENENAVHSLEHGAVWITYDPSLSAADLDALRAATPSSYAILSPYEGLPAPIVISAWGKQLQLDDPNDPELAAFIQKYWQSADAPEPGAPCTGALDGPGRVG